MASSAYEDADEVVINLQRHTRAARPRRPYEDADEVVINLLRHTRAARPRRPYEDADEVVINLQRHHVPLGRGGHTKTPMRPS